MLIIPAVDAGGKENFLRKFSPGFKGSEFQTR